MPLVGDIILSARETIPDMPQVAHAPGIQTPVAVAGGSLLLGTYYIVMTLLTPWGETIASNEATVILSGANHSFSVAWGSADINIDNYVAYRVYWGLGTGQQFQFQEVTNNGGLSGAANPAVVTAVGLPGSPPNRSSAYLPDTDGGMVNAFAMFRWLNEGLNLLSKKAGGVQDASGVPTVTGQSLYQLPFKWIKLTNLWFDGWELIKGTRSDIFYRNSITAIGNLTVTLKQSNTSIIEIFPQPNRTAGSSLTTTTPLTTTSPSFTVNTTGGWVLPFGLAMLGVAGGVYEIVGYASFSGNNFTGLVRGLGGTTPQAWPVGTPVRELNLRFEGYRMANTYKVGDSVLDLAIPHGWSDILNIFMNSKALDVQGDKTGAAKLRAEFMSQATAIGSANRLLQGPVQIGLGATNEVYNPGLGGGWYLP
jgi:hypothetical protein